MDNKWTSKRFSELQELSKSCVVCKGVVDSDGHRMLMCQHTFCPLCFKQLRQKQLDENTDQHCPADGIKIDFNNNFRQQIHKLQDRMEQNLRLVADATAGIAEQERKTSSLTDDITEFKNYFAGVKSKNVALNELLTQQRRAIHNKQDSIVSSREGILRMKNDLDEALGKVKKSLKLEKKELNSISKQCVDMGAKYEERIVLINSSSSRDLRSVNQGVGVSNEPDDILPDIPTGIVISDNTGDNLGHRRRNNSLNQG